MQQPNNNVNDLKHFYALTFLLVECNQRKSFNSVGQNVSLLNR